MILRLTGGSVTAAHTRTEYTLFLEEKARSIFGGRQHTLLHDSARICTHLATQKYF